MGTARWDLSTPAKGRGGGAPTIFGAFHASGNHTTSITASNLTDGAAGAGSVVTAPVGTILRVTCDELARVVIGGGTATATSGFLLTPDDVRDIEIGTAGTISIIDEA